MTDLEALRAAAVTTWDLARRFVFPGDDELLKDLPELTLDAASFRIEFRLQLDVLGWDSDQARTMIALRFAQAVQKVPESLWTLYIRGHWPERTDRLPLTGPLNAKKLRKAFSPKRRPVDDPRPNPFTSGHMYLMSTTPREDLTAQLCLFAVQTDLSLGDDQVFRWLEDHLTRTYCSRLRDREDVAREMLLRLIRNKWWTEDARGWRKYVGNVRRHVRRQYRVGLSQNHLESVVDPRTVRDPLEEGDDGSTHTNHTPSARRAASPYDPQGSVFTIEEASRRIGMSLSTLYSWVDHGRVAVEHDGTRRVIRGREVERLRSIPTLPTVIAVVARARDCSADAARRHVSRLRQRGRSLEDILRQYEETSDSGDRQS